MATTAKKERKISNIKGVIMISTAGMIDFLQFVLGLLLVGAILNFFISFMALISYWLWFALNGISFTKNMRAVRIGMTLFGTAFAEIIPIPFLNTLPFWTGGIIAIVIMTRVKEDV